MGGGGGRQGDWDAARTFMAAMAAEHDVKPDKRSYAELISACARANEFDEAIAAFKAMREEGVAPDIVLFSALITACANAGRCAEVTSQIQSPPAAVLTRGFVSENVSEQAAGRNALNSQLFGWFACSQSEAIWGPRLQTSVVQSQLRQRSRETPCGSTKPLRLLTVFTVPGLSCI